MRLGLVAAFALLLLSGCRKAEPPLSGGKPVNHWVQVLKDENDPSLRKTAAFKLGNVGPTDPVVLPALTGALKDADANVRCEAILALVKCGPAAKEAVPALTEVQNQDRDAKVRSYAGKALEKLQ